MATEFETKNTLRCTSLKTRAKIAWLGVRDDFRNWLQLGPEAREKT